MLSHIADSYLTSGIDGKRLGTAHPSLVPYQSFLTKDEKYLTIGAGNNRHFDEICSLLSLGKVRNFIVKTAHKYFIFSYDHFLIKTGYNQFSIRSALF
jgi:crotonobetainyl-CoA:carnitine CoA-transferase CaiB-like acyl-CoA transferase